MVIARCLSMLIGSNFKRNEMLAEYFFGLSKMVCSGIGIGALSPLFTEIQPASSAPAAAPAAAPAKAPEPPAPVSESVSARNLAGSLPD